MKIRHHVLLAFALGIGLGAAMMRWLPRGPSTDLPPGQVERPAAASTPGSVTSPLESGPRLPDMAAPSPPETVVTDARNALVSVRVLDAEGQLVLRTEAGLLGTPPVLVLPIRDLRGAATVILRDRAGAEATVFRVLAFDGGSGLAALDAGGLSGPGLSLAGQDHPLYLGRELALLTLSASIHGWVDGTQMLGPGGAFPVIPVRLPGKQGGGGGVLVEPESLRLVGLPRGPLGEGGVVGATEVDAVRELLDRIGRDETLPLPEFAEHYFHNTPAGMWTEIQHRMARGDWQQAMDLAAALMTLDASYHQRAVEMLERAATELVNSHLVAGRHAQALSTLRQAEQALGENVVLLSLYANTYTALKEFDLARDYLRRAVALDPERAPEALPRLRAVVLAQVRSLEREMVVSRIVTLLEEAVATDPGYAVYRQYLGRYYLRLGEYAAAIDQLREAVALDESLGPELFPLVADATVKLDLPELTEVPMQATHGVIHVDVRVNDSPQPVRFVLDTGASQTVISRSLADRLGIAIDDQGPRVVVQTANNAVSAPVVTLGSLSVGDARVENVQALVLDTLGDTEGLLGLTYLRHFDVAIEHRLGVVGLRRK